MLAFSACAVGEVVADEEDDDLCSGFLLLEVSKIRSAAKNTPRPDLDLGDVKRVEEGVGIIDTDECRKWCP